MVRSSRRMRRGFIGLLCCGGARSEKSTYQQARSDHQAALQQQPANATKNKKIVSLLAAPAATPFFDTCLSSSE